MRKLVPYVLVLCLLLGCGHGASQSDDATAAWDIDIPALYTSTTSISVHVAYESGYAPYTDTIVNNHPAWSVLEDNLNALFDGRAIVPDIIIPQSLSEMTALPEQGKTTWTTAEVFSLAQSVWSDETSSTTAHFHILFLGGNFVDNGAVKPTVIGISLNGKSVLAVFKEVITASSSSAVRRYVEQATVVHELGHALGLVNNGLPLNSAHQDTSHDKHCTNSNCVMYWQNEGGADLAAFVQQVIDTGETVMFGSECLDDALAYHPG